MVFRWMEFALKAVAKPHYRGVTQEKLEECLFLPLGSTAIYPGHAGIESLEAQIQEEQEFEPSWQGRGRVVKDLVSLLFIKQIC